MHGSTCMDDLPPIGVGALSGPAATTRRGLLLQGPVPIDNDHCIRVYFHRLASGSILDDTATTTTTTATTTATTSATTIAIADGNITPIDGAL